MVWYLHVCGGIPVFSRNGLFKPLLIKNDLPARSGMLQLAALIVQYHGINIHIVIVPVVLHIFLTIYFVIGYNFYLILLVLLQCTLYFLEKDESFLNIRTIFILFHPLIVYFLLDYINAGLLVFNL